MAAAASLTQQGQACMLLGAATPNGGIANTAVKLKLYDTTSVPAVDGSGFVEVAAGNGYTAGGQAITRANWTQALNGQNQQMTLAVFTWMASGGVLPSNSNGIGGAYITDVSGNVLAWWPASSPFRLPSGSTARVAQLSIELN